MDIQLKRLTLLRSVVYHSSFRWIVLFVVIGTVIATASYNYYEVERELTKVELLRREAVAQLMATLLKEKFGRAADVAISISTRFSLQDSISAGQWQRALKLQYRILEEMPYIDRLFLSDIRGTLKADSPSLPGVLGHNFATRDWYQGVSKSWLPYVSPIYTRAAGPRQNVIAVTVPVRNKKGQVFGILGLQLRIENLLEWIPLINTGNNAFTYIVDSKGQLAYHSKRPYLEKITSVADNPIVKKMQHGAQGVEISYDPETEEKAIIAYASVPDSDWGVVVQQPYQSSLGMQARDSLLTQLIVGYSLILLLVTLAATMLLNFANARREAEIELEMKANLERQVNERTVALTAANKELEAFSYSVSHDLRAPLRSIDGFSQALLENYAEKLDERGANYLGRVRNAAQHMGNLIDQMLMLSRVTRVDMQSKRVDLSALASEVSAELQATDVTRKVEWRIQPGLSTVGDYNLLRIVLVNLLGNAWKYTANQTKPIIEFGFVCHADGSKEFYVRDNGAGFDLRYADKLFSAFQRLHLTNEFAGTGIGLATVQRIIHRHNGSVHGTGVVDQGATFYFKLPIQVNESEFSHV